MTFQQQVASFITFYFTLGGVSRMTPAQLMAAHREAYALIDCAADAHAVASEIVFRINGVTARLAAGK